MYYNNFRIVFVLISFLCCGCVTYKSNVDEYKHTTVSGQIDGHDFVDLGLPSRLKWATYNMGTTNSFEKGEYFSWGELDTKDNYNWHTYKLCNSTNINKYNEPSVFLKYKYDSIEVNNKIILENVDDVAYMKWGKEWRIPTIEEFKELYDGCNWERIDNHQKGINGFYGTSKKNGNTIFLPTSGFIYINETFYQKDLGLYWTSTLKDDANAFVLEFGEDIFLFHRLKPRFCGLTVRAVSK